jgi:hypothetical protein
MFGGGKAKNAPEAITADGGGDVKCHGLLVNKALRNHLTGLRALLEAWPNPCSHLGIPLLTQYDDHIAECGVSPTRCRPAAPCPEVWYSATVDAQCTVAPPQHFLYFFPEPQGHSSFRPTLEAVRRGSDLNPVPTCS